MSLLELLLAELLLGIFRPTGYWSRWVSRTAFVRAEGQFVLSNGDPTGYGYHGDFINAWDIDFLQRAADISALASSLPASSQPWRS
ncbi:hypothetical protein W97_04424 [Coniosporium apollinis CBS 100218]|uniref:DUF1996 domain-containing protein n=1 Tax=Coniosporium apollinis (strain CBS 100218) TaxID=1168221 RepID=R7YTD4_CONA1|nr:uncharacterized protein W97_04424 [Coniosporium apollinis CBS 100218]EON65187.1 hypothetical protein W97_04424 [Coniosporium apollinis CBS 100218]